MPRPTRSTVGSHHVLVTRFAVPRPVGGSAGLYRDPIWLENRFELFRRYFAPSVDGLGIPVILLCGAAAMERVAEAVKDLPWARVVEQEEWRGGWSGEPHQTLSRLDSDDAVHRDWFAAVDAAPPGAQVCITRRSLRYDPKSGRLHRYRRREPAPLAAFRGGQNPYAVDHKYLGDLPAVHRIPGPHLLQVVHGGNLKNRPPKAWRLDRRVSPARLREFGLR